MTKYKVPLAKQLQVVSSLMYDGVPKSKAVQQAAKQLGLHTNTVRYNVDKTIKEALLKYR
jgi:sugar diacid utilization regulator